ncbi:ComF family protein [Vibrio sp. JPW-9-11-11]|uniref:ComF family protein n=1 Tax=Vibrio sp. JPW-9-11-11 TaxID=1416532 RepID=UPI00159327BD|nr:ComF family protein [Vibrio sp. JPW-9-11-11]NVD05340.1 ComF family protein [Vibrio sp. JPW-9-11-11]
MLAQIFHKYIADLLPCHCELCLLPIHTGTASSSFCAVCLGYFAPIERCLRCGLPCVDEPEQCGHCLKRPPLWHRLYCVGDYQLPLASYVHRLKYQRQFWQADKLAQLLSGQITQPAELITYVPLHWQRAAWRGFNQSERLAHALAKQLAIPCASLFRRTHATRPQQGLNRAQRLANLTDVFALKSLPNMSRIAIVDDVVTTGSTVQHLCKLLLDAGVKNVDIYCICRTPDPVS